MSLGLKTESVLTVTAELHLTVPPFVSKKTENFLFTSYLAYCF